MKIITKSSLWLFGPLLCAVLLASCKKNDEMEQFNPSRAFTPTGITTTVTGAQVKIDWRASLFSNGTGLTYTVDVSKAATFATIDYTTQTSAVTLTLTDEQLTVGQPYFVRIRANATETTPGSTSALVTTSAFTMPGILQTVANADLTGKTAILRWLPAPDVTKITITPTTAGTGSPFDVALTPADIAANFKLITGLTGAVTYRADIYAGSRVKGFTTFTTPLFTRTVLATENIVDAINNAADGDILGLSDGTYNAVDALGAYVNITILQKTVTLQSISGDPAKVKINFKQIDLKGTGAGFGARNVTFDGTAGAAPYFLNMIGAAADADNATFTNINIDNCVVSNVVNAFLRGNRVSATGGFVIGNININNSIVFNINPGASAGFNTIELSKVQFGQLNITNSTFYEFGRNLVTATTLLTGGIPVVNINQNTFNSFGGNNMFVLVDANTNALRVTANNNILGNIPRAATGAQGFLRGTGAGSAYTFNNNNVFAAVNMTAAVLPVTNASTTVQTANNTAISLPWTSATTTFTLPAGSPLRTGSTTGGAVGDPRWAR
jgi:hypothetical protein